MKEKAKELWEEKYGDSEYSFDFANKLIIKSEYQTNSPFSWDTDIYDFGDEASFIANIETIKARDKKPVFEIDNVRYIVTRNPNYSYSILSPSKISDEKCPINFDLFLNSKINNYTEKDYSFIIISLRKMEENIENIFNSYVIEYFKIFKQLISFDFDNSSYSRTELKFQFINSDEFTIKKTFEIALTLSSLMPLIIHRLSSLETKLWKHEDSLNDEHYYNIFFTIKNNNENYFELKNIKILGMINMFENGIFLDESTKKAVVNKGISIAGFAVAKNSIEEGIYQYEFSRTDISQYNEIILSKSK
ncbi:MAG: hypothetical protein ACRC1F_00415 [Metamycoplasmataceae bacterium]